MRTDRTRHIFNPIEIASRDEISALQLERMQWTVRRCYNNVPFWKKRFDEHGVHPDDLKSLEDLQKFPFMTKSDFRDNYPFGLVASSPRKVVRVHASSGTTGKPTIVAYTKNDIEMWSEAVARSCCAAGIRPTDIVQNAYGYGLFTGGLGAHYGIERLGATAIPISGGMTTRQIQTLYELKSDAIMVTPSYMLKLGESIIKAGLNPADTNLKVGIFGAEPWTHEMRDYIEEIFDIDAVDIYGLSEVCGPGVAQESVESKDGLNVWEDLFYPEIIDPETGEVLPDGKKGELVFTSLQKEALPVVRYRTGDITRLLPGSTRSMRRIEKIKARIDDMIILRGVNIYPSLIEEQILKVDGLTPNYLIERYSDGSLDQLRVRVERKNADLNPGDLSKALQYNIKSGIGSSVQVVIEDPDTLPRFEGKATHVVDLRDKN